MTSLAPLPDTSTDTGLFTRVMAPYASKETIYLTEAPEVSAPGGILRGIGDFHIPEPCYIDDTGHFNAAEFIICYNQLMYHTLAAAVRDSLTPEFAHWTLDDFWDKQLPDVLIAQTTTKFSRPVTSAAFRGEFTVTSMTERISSRRMLLADTEISFTDSQGGRCSGTITLAIIEPPLAR